MCRQVCTVGIKLISLLALSAFACSALHAQSSFAVNIDTTVLNGVKGGVSFDLFSGDMFVQNNRVKITSFSTDATLYGAVNIITGNAIGDLPADLTLAVSGSTESFRGLTFGNSLSFIFTSTTNRAPLGDDGFAFYLTNFDNTGSAVSTSDPTGGNALFLLDIDGTPTGTLSLYSVFAPKVKFSVSPVSNAVPEPLPSHFLIVGLVGLGLGVSWKTIRRTRKFAS